jgi:hypothetical protein
MIPINTRASLPNVSATVIATQDGTTPNETPRFSALSARLIRGVREPYEDWYLSNPRGRFISKQTIVMLRPVANMAQMDKSSEECIRVGPRDPQERAYPR